MRDIVLLTHIIFGISSVFLSIRVHLYNSKKSMNGFKATGLATLTTAVGLLLLGASLGRTCLSALTFTIVIVALRQFKRSNTRTNI